jgi:pimeloyl-ACP methyl ester carboxylesterase
MAPENPAILIIHGGYFLPTAWDAFNDQLTKAGLVVRCPRLPTCGDKQPPTATLEEDVTAVRSAAKDLIDTGHNVIVLAHSYGGIVASEALTSDLYANEATKGIVHIIFLSAWLVQPGDTLEDVIGKYGFQCKVDLGSNGDGTVFAKNAAEAFFNDIDSATAEELAKGNVTHNWPAVSEKVTGAPWKDLPTTYVHCTRDLAIMLPLQKSMVQEAINAGGAPEFVTEIIDSGHCPFLSKPDELISIVKALVSVD